MKYVIQIKKLIFMISKYWYIPRNRLKFILNGIKCGQGLNVRGNIHIYKHHVSAKLIIGEDVTFNSASWANPIGCGNRVYFQLLKNSKLVIGDRCGISNTAFTCAESITLGNDILIGAGCKIYDTDFHPIMSKYRYGKFEDSSQVKTKPIIIEDGAFLGAASIILKGVHIGKNSIIGAGSVVASDVPSGEIWAGNPARYIRKVEQAYHD